MTERRYAIRPKAQQDLGDQAYHYATEANSELGHRFLMATYETCALLATQPEIGWRPKVDHPDLGGLRIFRVTGFEKILILYRPIKDGIEVLRIIHGSRNIQRLLRHEGIE